MGKLNTTPRIGIQDTVVLRELREHATQVNMLSEGKLSAEYGAMTAAPTSGVHARGDFVRNSAPSELGSMSSMYVIFGWVCVAGGSPGTFVECRFLTGN